MSHIHREVVGHGRQSEALLNLYGRLRKGVEVITDMGSPLQRRLMAIGLIEIDEQGQLCIRNRIYETVFTARWANENLPTHWRAPTIAAAALLIVLAIPMWYTQWLPNSYVEVLTSASVDLRTAETTWLNLRSFPGHADGADNIYRNFLEGRAVDAADEATIMTISDLAAAIPDSGSLPQQLLAEFWDRRVGEAMRTEQRDVALLAALESLVLSTTKRRHRAAMLIGDDYPLLIAALPPGRSGDIVFDSAGLLVTAINGSQVSQWSLSLQALQPGVDWTMTAIEVTPLLRRVAVDRDGQVRRLGLTINLSHQRLADLRVKLIAPSGRAVEVDTGLERASSNEDIRISTAQLRELIGEPLSGTWSLSIRDEVLGVAGHLVGWNLTLNAQGLVEDFQRGLDIPDPVERETDNVWTSSDGRYAVA
ncbi:MAG: proprotein convertase P-domain-containing protein, partial [Proteobacteria bacterium]|nr:proprotein convertase P-domain-containing protein [Pseudomonadota bacterium]